MRVQLVNSIVGLLLLAVISPVTAAEDAAKGKKNPVEQQVKRRFELPEAVALSPEQKTKLEEIKKEYASKVQEAIEKREGLLTAEQKQARQAAQKAARQSGKKQKEAHEAGVAALNLSGDQLKQYTAAEDAVKKVDEEIKGKIAGILTDEQKATIKKEKAAA